MSTPLRFRTVCAALLPWLVTLLTWLLARSLNMPESIVHATYVFVFAQVRIAENSVGKSLCSTTPLRQLLQHCRRSSATPDSKGDPS